MSQEFKTVISYKEKLEIIIGAAEPRLILGQNGFELFSVSCTNNKNPPLSGRFLFFFLFK